jgi:type III secretory pathway lipoprotein EscJ
VAVSIEDSLNAMSGVLEARVHLNLPETDPLFGTRKQDAGSGSVLLVVDGRYLAKDEEVSGLVSGAAGIPATRVTVLKSQAQMTTPPHQTAQHLLRDTEAISLGPQRKGRFSIEPRQVGVVSAALAACAVIGWMVFRLRRKRVTFSLPEDLEVEGDNV